jgi:membrane-bound serine protease (ClpP class)
MIYGFTLESLQRRVDRALHNGASVIVLELDTPGGVLTSALDISKYVKTIPVHTVAWINNEAYSAGILIASACDELVMSPAAATGDAAPVVPGFGLGATERAKALSPLLEEFRDNARANGYDYTLFHAMCVLGVEVYRVRNPQTGETRLVNQVDYAVMVEGREPDSVAPAAPAADPAAAADPATVGAVRLEEATSADAGRWELVSRIHDGTTLLTLNQTRAEEVGLSAATIASRAELAQFLNAANVYTVDQTWSEDLAGYVYFLTHPLAKAILVMVLLIGAYIELQSPGFGFGGALALLALVALIGAPLVVGLAEWWHLGAFVLGLVLLGVELFVLPGFGVFGIAGLLLAFIGLVFAGGRVAVGDTGRVVTGLRPAGRVEINGQLIDAVTPGNWIDRGRDVKIIEVRGNRIVVDAV